MSDSGSDGDSDRQYFDLIRRLLVENYCILASSALLWFDHIISFNEEVQRIWQRKFTGATLLFLITRYSATLERITLVVSLFLVTNENKVCVPVLRLDDPLNDISIFIVGAFAALRLYAIFGRDWRLLVFMLGIALTRTGISIYFQSQYIPIAFGPPLWGCGAEFDLPGNLYYRLQTTTNALNLAADTLLLILTWVKTFEIRRASNGTGVRTPVSTLLLRDGTLYFVLICGIQIFAIVSIQIGSDFPLFAVWTYWNQSFTVIFLCRFMLNLRGVSGTSRGSPSEVSTNRASDIHFASNIIGNLGAPLDIGSSPTAVSDASSDTEADRDTAYDVHVHVDGGAEDKAHTSIIEVSRNPRRVRTRPSQEASYSGGDRNV